MAATRSILTSSHATASLCICDLFGSPDSTEWMDRAHPQPGSFPNAPRTTPASRSLLMAALRPSAQGCQWVLRGELKRKRGDTAIGYVAARHGKLRHTTRICGCRRLPRRIKTPSARPSMVDLCHYAVHPVLKRSRPECWLEAHELICFQCHLETLRYGKARFI